MRSATGKLWARGRVGGLPWKLRPRAGLFQNMQRAEAAAWASSEDSRALSATLLRIQLVTSGGGGAGGQLPGGGGALTAGQREVGGGGLKGQTPGVSGCMAALRFPGQRDAERREWLPQAAAYPPTNGFLPREGSRAPLVLALRLGDVTRIRQSQRPGGGTYR